MPIFGDGRRRDIAAADRAKEEPINRSRWTEDVASQHSERLSGGEPYRLHPGHLTDYSAESMRAIAWAYSSWPP